MTAEQQAVIEAARAVLRQVAVSIEPDYTQGCDYLRVAISIGKMDFVERFYEDDKPFPNTLLGTLAALSGAVDALDETMAESEGE